MTKHKSAYARAGVDIDEMMQGLKNIKRMVKKTATDGVLSDIGSFGGLFKSPGSDHLIVASTDGVGTKLKVAKMAKRHDTVGQDLVNHCVNDILVQGAHPLFFMDYVGTAKLSAPIFEDVVSGLCKACTQNNCALLGGETAEMPGLYPIGEYDLVGTIVGSVARKALVTGADIEPGDAMIGLPSNGLHTNGYSLARQVFFEAARLRIGDVFPGTSETVADVLLAVHKSYLKPVMALMDKVKIRGMAHITGGGLIDNIPRILPKDTCAMIDRTSWETPALFKFLKDRGGIEREEMYRVFNMGIGYVIIVAKDDLNSAMAALRSAKAKPTMIGHIATGENCVGWIA